MADAEKLRAAASTAAELDSMKALTQDLEKIDAPPSASTTAGTGTTTTGGTTTSGTDGTTTGDEPTGATTTDTEGTTTGDDSKTKKKKKGKGKKKGSKGKKKRKKRKKKGKKKKRKKRSKRTEEPSGPTYTEEDIQSYIQKREKHKQKVREQRLLVRMKQLVSIVRENDTRWNRWTEDPLSRFIRDPNVDVVTIYIAKVETKKTEKSLLWIGEDLHENNNEQVQAETTLTAEKSAASVGLAFSNTTVAGNNVGGAAVENQLEKLATISNEPTIFDPFKRFDNEMYDDEPLGPIPFVNANEKGERLIVINGVEANNSPDLFYFVKIVPVSLRNDNFFQTVAFGNAPLGHLSSLHHLLTYIYLPIFSQPDVLPDSIRNDFMTNMNKLMNTITETHYGLQNQTMLYVPKDIANMPIDVASRDKELCARLQDTMIHWIRQIKNVLKNQDVLDLEGGPLDELAFWEQRYNNLDGLKTQIQSKAVRLVRDIMQIIKSPYVDQFNTVASEILEGSEEAYSNLQYLNTLREPCEKLHESKIKDIPEQLDNILTLIRAIWLESPYYNTRDKLNGLFRRISNELILRCIAEIDVEKIFKGYILSSEVTLHEALECLSQWRIKYMEAQKYHSMTSNVAWLLEYDKIFSHVDAFSQRLKDLLEICTCQKLFARRFEGNQEDLPEYPGTKAADITRVMKDVQKMFDAQLRRLYNYSHTILDVKNATWHDQMSSFRIAVKDMENMVQNILFSAFDSVRNIEEGVELLRTFYNFYERQTIVRAYDKLTVKLFKMFEDETALVKSLFSKFVLPIPKVSPQVAARAAWALFMKQRLDSSARCLNEAAFLPECGYGSEAMAQYKAFAETLVDFSNKMYDEWLKLLGTKDLSSRLEIPLMIRSTTRPGMIEVNFDKVLQEQITEGEIWLKLNKAIPDVLLPVFRQRDLLREVRETVLLVVNDYNGITEVLSEEERSLFKGRIKVLERKVYNGLTKLNWASDVSDAYIHDCRMAATKVQGYINDYKKANVKIAKLAMKMSNIPMIRMDSKRLFSGLDFNIFQTAYREKAILKIAYKYKDITIILKELFDMFSEDGEEVQVQWIKYLNVIDEIVKEALCTNLRRSLEVLRRGIEGDVRSLTKPSVIKLDVIIETNKINFDPNIPTVIDMILGIYPAICETILPFPRVIQYLTDETTHIQSFSHILANDEQSRATQEYISHLVVSCTTQMEKFLKIFSPFRDVWEVNRDTFMPRYEKLMPTVESFDMDIGRYTEVINIILSQENIHIVGFCVLDCSKIKISITEECKLWQDRICNLLFHMASNLLTANYLYINEAIKKLSKKPETMIELGNSDLLLRTRMTELSEKEASFSDMYDQFECLVKYEFDLGEEMNTKVENFDDEWQAYAHKLKEIENMLKGVKIKMKKGYASKPEEFRKKVEELIDDYNQFGPNLDQGITEDVAEDLGLYLQVAEELRVEEQELLLAMELLKVALPPNANLKQFVKKIERLLKGFKN